MAPLIIDSHATDTVPVRNFLVNFVSGNDTTEAKIQGLSLPNDGHDTFTHLFNITKALEFMLLTFVRRTKSSRAYSMPAKTYRICGGPSSRSDSLGHSMLMLNEEWVGLCIRTP